jgi:hypothetical protein
MRALPEQSADNALQGAVHDLHHHPFVNQRTWIVLKIALNQPAGAFYLETESAQCRRRTTRCSRPCTKGSGAVPRVGAQNNSRGTAATDLLLAIFQPLTWGWSAEGLAFSLELVASFSWRGASRWRTTRGAVRTSFLSRRRRPCRAPPAFHRASSARRSSTR